MRFVFNGRQIRKVAVIDIDAHHGNGTEEVIRWAAGKRGWTPATSPVFFASVHLYHRSPNHGEFYPGTGQDNDTIANFINCPMTPLWAQTGRRQRGQRGNNSGREAWREALERKVIPALRAFTPDLTFLSAGFDGAK